MTEDSNLPSAVRDSDTVDDDSVVGPTLGRSSPGTVGHQSESIRIGVLEQKLEQQNNDIANLTTAFESLRNAYVERMNNVESELKRNNDEFERNKNESKRNKDEIESLKKRLSGKDNEILELKKKVQSSEENVMRLTKLLDGVKLSR